MTEQTISVEEWPNYYWALPEDQIHAIGVISLNHNRLERIFREMFIYCTGETESIFHQLTNKKRIKKIEELLDCTSRPDYRQAVIDFLKAYDICTDNRNAIMHAFSPGSHTSRSTGETGILLVKYDNKTGQPLHYPANRDLLRAVADEMNAWCSYGADINSRLRNLDAFQAGGHDPATLPALPNKPDEPAKMDFSPLPNPSSPGSAGGPKSLTIPGVWSWARHQ